MSAQKHPGPLPREVLDLAALRGAVLAVPQLPDMSAHRLMETAFGQGGQIWAPVRRLLATRDILLRNAWIRYAGGQALAIGRLRCLDRASGVFYVVIDGAPL